MAVIPEKLFRCTGFMALHSPAFKKKPGKSLKATHQNKYKTLKKANKKSKIIEKLACLQTKMQVVTKKQAFPLFYPGSVFFY